MTIYRGAKRAQDYEETKLILSLRRVNSAWESAVLIVRRDSDDATTSVYYNTTTSIIDDDSLTSDGSTTLSAWKDAAGAADLYVAEWFDTSGAGNHVAQSTTTQQPELELNGSGSRAKMLFDGVDDWLYANVDYVSPSTVFVVSQTPIALGFDSMFGSQISTATDSFSISRQGELNRYASFATDSLGVNYGLGNYLTSLTADPILLTLKLDGINNCKGYANGVQGFDTTRADGMIGLYNRFNIAKGRFNDYIDGYMDEYIIIMKSLTDTEQACIEQDQLNYYGIN